MPNVNLSPYTAESEAIANRMRMAQLIGQQSMQPMEMPQQPGAKFSPYQGLAKMMQAYVSVLGQNKAVEQQKELQNKIGTEATDWIANYSSGIKGTPNTPEQTYKPGEADYREMGMMGKDLQVNPQGMAVEPAQAGIPTRARTAEEQQAYLGQGMKNPLTSAMATALLNKNIENQNFQNILRSAGMGNAPTAPMGGAPAAPTSGMQPTGGGITGNINPNILAMSGDPRAIELAKYLSGQNKIKNFDVELIDKVPTRVGLTESGNKIIVGPVEQALSPDTAARLKQEKEISDRAFNQLSAKDKADLADKAIGRNISAQQLFFDTGIKAGGGTFVNPLAQPPAQPNVAPNAPPMRPAPAGAVAPTSAPVAGAPVAPVAGAYTPLTQLSPKAQQEIEKARIMETVVPKPLTEAQGNATAFGMRMAESNKLLKNLEDKGVTNTGLIRQTIGATVGVLPLVGDKLQSAVKASMNPLPSVLGGPSSGQQEYDQAKQNFITAVLRKESGAAIGVNEFKTEDEKYFPQAGDSDKVIAQKQSARELAIKAMGIQAGPQGARNITGGVPSSNDGVSANNPLGLPGR
jgi:hypothetical protein